MNKDEIRKFPQCTYYCPDCKYFKDGYCAQPALITDQEREIELLKTQMKDVVNHADTFLAEATKFEAENKKLKAENKMRLINLHTALDDIKQAKIEALNELRGRADLAGIVVVTVSDIDEMIEELKK